VSATPSGVPLVILAGGRATRLGSLSDDCPKFLTPVGDELTFADLQLAWARDQGFLDVTLAVGYRASQIEAYCGHGDRYGLRLAYSDDGPVLIGTGGAVRKAFPRPAGLVAVLYGDTILDLDTRAVIELARATGAEVVMTALRDPPAGHTCNIGLEGDRMIYSKAHPAPAFRHIDYGFLVLSPGFISQLPETSPFDLATALEAASARGAVRGFQVSRPFWEINTPEALGLFRRRFGDE
jgi:NDP-sugar pyrophosphorylase family protein